MWNSFIPVKGQRARQRKMRGERISAFFRGGEARHDLINASQLSWHHVEDTWPVSVLFHCVDKGDVWLPWQQRSTNLWYTNFKISRVQRCRHPLKTQENNEKKIVRTLANTLWRLLSHKYVYIYSAFPDFEPFTRHKSVSSWVCLTASSCMKEISWQRNRGHHSDSCSPHSGSLRSCLSMIFFWKFLARDKQK